jgi:hypothetical protein
MRMNSPIEGEPSEQTETPDSGPAEAPPRALIEAATRRAEVAEARALALEVENKALRSERARSILAAARNGAPSAEAASLRAEQAEAKARGLEAENQQLRSVRTRSALATAQDGPQSLDAVRRRAEEAEARALALAAENTQLRAERTKAIMAAAKAERAAAGSLNADTADPDQKLAALTHELKTAEDALRASERERESAARSLEGSLRQAFAERLDAMRQGHAAELEARSRESKERFAEELMSAVSTANAAWKKDTEARVRAARKRNRAGLARVQAIWRLRSRAALLQAARVWRGREKQRLADARQKWDVMHREALEACNRRWQARYDRLRRRMRRPLRMPSWQPTAWRAPAERLFRAAGCRLAAMGRAFRAPAPRQMPGSETGLVAVAVLLLAVLLPPTAPFFPADAGPMVAAATSEPQVASLPGGQPGDGRDKHAAAPPDKTAAPRDGYAPRAFQNPDVKRETNGRAITPPPQPPAKPTVGPTVGPNAGADQADTELKLRLLEKIQKLRTDLSIR